MADQPEKKTNIFPIKIVRNLYSHPRFPEISILGSLLIHAMLFLLLFCLSPIDDLSISIQPPDGSSIRIHTRFQAKGRGEQNNPMPTNPTEGAISPEEEIERFKKHLSYPALAFERGLESDCEWVVTVAENGKPGNVEEYGKCRYRIFDRKFREDVQKWEFRLPSGTKLRIPVSYKIDRQYEK